MADYSLQDFWWNKPPRAESQLPALQLGVQMVQNKARLDLQERQLADDMARTDIARTESIAKLKLQTDISAANAELARLAAQVNDFSDPAQMKPIYDHGARNGHIVGTKGWDGIINVHERAVTAKRLGANTQSLIESRAARAELARLDLERKELLADSTVDLNDARIIDLNERMALGQQKLALDEKKLALQSMLADSTMDYNDARIAKYQQDIGLAERRILIQEGNLALRAQDIAQKGKRLDARAQASYNNELKALNEEEKAKLKAVEAASTTKTAEADALESDRLRKFYNLKRRAVTERFYGPASTNAPAMTPRVGLQAEPDRGTNAPPAVVAPNNDARANEIKASFKAGKITKEQALEQLRELGFK